MTLQLVCVLCVLVLEIDARLRPSRAWLPL